jgi:translation elongation factor EF-1beta
MLYFITRENTHEGPFDSREEALREIQAYIERVQVLQMSR